MAISPCIEDSSCIDLSVQPNSNLRADLIVSDDAGNCVECRADGLYVPCGDLSTDPCNAIVLGADGGLWAGQQAQNVQCSSFESVSTGILGVGIDTVWQSGTLIFENPSDCVAAVYMRTELYGTLQITGMSPGGRAVYSYATGIFPNPLIDGGYAVLQNPAGAALEHAWPPHAAAIPSCGTTIPAGASAIFAFQRRLQITAGSITNAIFRDTFIFNWSVALA